MESAPALPDGVLVQSTYVNDEGDEAGWRVWADGRQEGRRADGDWIVGPALTTPRMAELRRILDTAGLDEMAGEHLPEAATEHAGTLWFQVARSDGLAIVALVGGARLDALDRLTIQLAPLLSGGAFPAS